MPQYKLTVLIPILHMHCFSIILQAVFGMLLFGESLALLWWLGASLIVLGLLLLNYASQQSELATEPDKKQQ